MTVCLTVPEVHNTEYMAIGPYFIPIVITIFCYIRTIQVLRKNPIGMKTKGHALFLYPTVQLLLLLSSTAPTSIKDDPDVSFKAKILVINIAGLPVNLIGFANAAIYLFQKRRKAVKNHPRKESMNSSLLEESK